MAVIKKKIWAEYFDAIVSGRKKFELRLADFDVAEGDTLVLQEWDKHKKEYTGREITKKVTYVLKLKLDDLARTNPQEDWDKHGMQILSIE